MVCGVGTDAVSRELLAFLRALLTLSQTSAADAVHRFARSWRLPPRAVRPLRTPINGYGHAARGARYKIKAL
jgi:hypothetical protein